MRYIDFREAIQRELSREPNGLTWSDLRDRLDLPYDRACPARTKLLDREIGLSRVKGSGRSLVWILAAVPQCGERGWLS